MLACDALEQSRDHARVQVVLQLLRSALPQLEQQHLHDLVGGRGRGRGRATGPRCVRGWVGLMHAVNPHHTGAQRFRACKQASHMPATPKAPQCLRYRVTPRLIDLPECAPSAGCLRSCDCRLVQRGRRAGWRGVGRGAEGLSGGEVGERRGGGNGFYLAVLAVFRSSMNWFTCDMRTSVVR